MNQLPNIALSPADRPPRAKGASPGLLLVPQGRPEKGERYGKRGRYFGIAFSSLPLLAAILGSLFLLSCEDPLEFEYETTIGQEDASPGSDNGSFNSPVGLALDGDGNLYVADRLNHRIQIFDTSLNWKDTIGTNSVSGDDDNSFNNPIDVAIDTDGNIYVADQNNHRLQIFNSSHVYQSTIGMTGDPGNDDEQLDSPTGVATVELEEEIKVSIVDRDNHRLQIFASSAIADGAERYSYQYQTTIGESGVSGSGNNQFNRPSAVAVTSSGTIYIVDRSNHRLQVFDEDNQYRTTVGRSEDSGSSDNQFYNPSYLAFDSDGRIYVADETNHRIQVLNSGHGYQTTIGMTDSAGSDNESFRSPGGVAADNGSRVYIADTGNHRIQVFRRKD